MDSETVTGDDIFQCRQCGACCQGYGGTYVSDTDMARIADYLEIDRETFKSRCCALSGSRYLLSQGEDGRCIFYSETAQCTIHPVKPYMCRAWPFINAVLVDPGNWHIMAGMCPGIKKNVPADTLKKIVRQERERLHRLHSPAE